MVNIITLYKGPYIEKLLNKYQMIFRISNAGSGVGAGSWRGLMGQESLLFARSWQDPSGLWGGAGAWGNWSGVGSWSSSFSPTSTEVLKYFKS